MLASIGAYIASDRQLLTPFGQIVTVTGVYDIPAAYVTHRRRAVEHQPDRAVSRRRPARSDLSDRTHHRSRGRANSASIRSNCAAATSFQPQKLPYKAPLGPVYDCGEFAKNMDLALEAADYAGFAARRDGVARAGKLRGIALVNAIEQAAGPVPEYAEVRFQPERQRDAC